MTSEFGIAVHAMVFLHHKGDMVSSEVLAENICTNPARVRKVMARLKRAGLVSTKEGADGGYLFSGDPRQISLQQVARALEARCVSSAWRSGDTDMDCLIASGMAAVMDELFADLDSRCMERLGEIALSDLEARLFSAGTRPCGKKREAGRRE